MPIFFIKFLKLQSRLILGTGIIIVSSALPVTSHPIPSRETTFHCIRIRGILITVARNPAYGEVPVIRWVSNYFSSSGYDPLTRCQMVSARFQSYYSQGILNYLTTGVMNGQPVICTSRFNAGSCEKLLFTLKDYSNPSHTLRRLLALRSGAGAPLNESNNRSDNQKIYINFEQYLKRAATKIKVNSFSSTLDSKPKRKPDVQRPVPTQDNLLF